MLLSWKSLGLMAGTGILFVLSVLSYKRLIINLNRFTSDIELWKELELKTSELEGKDSE
jgi:hypothetical protein